MDYQLILILISSFFMLCMILILVIVLINTRKTNEINHEMNRSIYEIKTSLTKDFIDFTHLINDELHNFSERMNSNLIQSNKTSNELFYEISEKMVRIDETQKGLSSLSEDVLSLQYLLKDKKSRGIFGETELYNLLETIYGNNQQFYRKQYLLNNHTLADAVLFLSADEIVCVDAKFPLEHYTQIYDDNLNDTQRKQAKKLFREDVRKQIQDIADKYINPPETINLAYMFVPSEAVFSEIYSQYPELIELSYRLKVFIVSPTTLMAYITAIKSLYLGKIKDDKAKEIEALLNQLGNEFDKFSKRSEELYKIYENLGNAFSSLHISSNKIIKQFQKIDHGELDDFNQND